MAGALSTLGVNLSRFTKDLLFWATQESGAIRIDDSFIQISSIMPQKRNPVVLEHLRARISRMLAAAQGIVLQCHNIPFGDTQDIEDEIFPLLFGSLETAGEILQLYRAVIDTLEVNVAHLRERAGAGFTTVTELADTLVRRCHLPFRQAHGLVSALVNHAQAHDLAPEDLSAATLKAVAAQALGLDVELPDAEFARALDPRAFVLARDLPGGAAPSATAAVLRCARLSRNRTGPRLARRNSFGVGSSEACAGGRSPRHLVVVAGGNGGRADLPQRRPLPQQARRGSATGELGMKTRATQRVAPTTWGGWVGSIPSPGPLICGNGAKHCGIPGN